MKVAEALVVALLVLLFVRGAWEMLARGADAARRIVRNGEVVETGRLVGGLLDRELVGARPGLDWRADPDGVALRAWRGTVVACPGDSAAGLAGWYRGLRRPDPTKDSLELVLADGSTAVVALRSVTGADLSGGPCAPRGPEGLRLRWDGDDASPRPALARVFETGLYAVDGALRYRRGAGGRQPLTPLVLDAGASALTAGPEGVEVSMVPLEGEGEERTRRWVR